MLNAKISINKSEPTNSTKICQDQKYCNCKKGLELKKLGTVDIGNEPLLSATIKVVSANQVNPKPSQQLIF